MELSDYSICLTINLRYKVLSWVLMNQLEWYRGLLIAYRLFFHLMMKEEMVCFFDF